MSDFYQDKLRRLVKSIGADGMTELERVFSQRPQSYAEAQREQAASQWGEARKKALDEQLGITKPGINQSELLTNALRRIAELEIKLRNETIERETFQHGMRQQERRIEQLEREKAELAQVVRYMKAVLELAAMKEDHTHYHYIQSRRGSMVRVAEALQDADAVLHKVSGATATEGGEG